MKAQEYVDKYQKEIMSSDLMEQRIAAKELISELLIESQHIAKTRNVVLGKSYISILKEQNQKWNAISSRMGGILKRDFFIEFAKTKVFPEYSHLF